MESRTVRVTKHNGSVEVGETSSSVVVTLRMGYGARGSYMEFELEPYEAEELSLALNACAESWRTIP